MLQEPVAAALAAMAGARDRSGVFLVYDFGGGTFDAALIHAQEGEVTVLAHEGINMLGGRDLDRGIIDGVATAWLRRTFDLPANWAVDPKFSRLLRVARRAAEVAKITLSTREETTVSASDDEVRLEDLRGEPIYLDVPLSRTKLEQLAAEAVERSIVCCRDMVANAGFRHEDVARVVLIGGPTKMPLLRRRVQGELGIQVEDIDRVDPMTAVAIGAAIYCEGRDWSAVGSTAKATRLTETGGRAVAVAFEFDARTSSDRARLKVTQKTGEAGAEVLVESDLGWSSGRRKLPATLDLPLSDPGPNRFRATVFSADGVPIADAGREIIVEHSLASTGGVPATHAIGAKILDDNGQNTLDVLVHKGELLPKSGFVRYRLVEPMRAGAHGIMRIELFQIADVLVCDPTLNLCVGEFQVRASDLPEGGALRRGDEVIVHWAMSEGQEITTEVELPSVGQRFDRNNHYNWQLAQQNFVGEDGARLAATQLDLVERDLAAAEDVVPPAHAGSLPKLRQRLDRHTAAARGTLEPEARRTAVEDARKLRQEIAKVCRQPDARRHLLRRRLNQQKTFYERDIRAGATRDQVARVDTLLGSAATLIEDGGPRELDHASEQIHEVNRLYWRYGLLQDRFCAAQFRLERDNRHLARDPAAFERSIAEGEEALAAGNFVVLREALVGIWLGQVKTGDGIDAAERASLMRA